MEKKSSKSGRSASDGRTDSQRGALISSVDIQPRIFSIRGQRVMLSTDLAELYGVRTKALIQAVNRNVERFPPDFMFQLENGELESLRSQIVTSNGVNDRKTSDTVDIIDNISKTGAMRGRGGSRRYPYVFTEQGVAMLSSVLRSKRAIAVNIEIMRAFVRLKREIYASSVLSKRLDELERRYDSQFKMVFDAIRRLMQQPEVKKRKIGFELTGRSTKND
jgi:hypothetical protein